MQDLIERLQTKSKYTRKKVSSYHELIYLDQGNFSIDLLTTHDDSKLQQAYDFLSEIFGPEMDDYENIVNEWIFDSNIAYHALSDSEGRVIAAANSSYMPLENSESILAVWYVAVGPEFRGKRLANELYQNIYQFALDRAEDQNSNLKAIVGEAFHKDIGTIGRVLNREEIARKRVYYHDLAGQVKEVPYASPPLRWNVENGMPEEEAQANHLMAKLTDGRERMSSQELLQMVKAIYKDSYFPREEDFRNKESYDRAFVMVNNYLGTIETALAGARGGEVFLR